jgi:hypothetical protein
VKTDDERRHDPTTHTHTKMANIGTGEQSHFSLAHAANSNSMPYPPAPPHSAPPDSHSHPNAPSSSSQHPHAHPTHHAHTLPLPTPRPSLGLSTAASSAANSGLSAAGEDASGGEHTARPGNAHVHAAFHSQSLPLPAMLNAGRSSHGHGGGMLNGMGGMMEEGLLTMDPEDEMDGSHDGHEDDGYASSSSHSHMSARSHHSVNGGNGGAPGSMSSSLGLSGALSRALTSHEAERLAYLDRLKFFLATAPSRWDAEEGEGAHAQGGESAFCPISLSSTLSFGFGIRLYSRIRFLSLRLLVIFISIFPDFSRIFPPLSLPIPWSPSPSLSPVPASFLASRFVAPPPLSFEMWRPSSPSDVAGCRSGYASRPLSVRRRRTVGSCRGGVGPVACV